jgi:hypothetical protein
MLKILERGVAAIDRRLVLVAPPEVPVSREFRNVTIDPQRRQQLVSEVQRLRGSIYVEDGALQRHQLSPDGLHQTPEDERSWHLLFMNKEQQITACAWYLEHDDDASFDCLRLRNCPLSNQPEWRDTLATAVESELARARDEGLRYTEVGGWAVAKESRCTSEGLLLALGAYSLGRMLGGALGVTTATVRHSSSAILRRLGGSHLEADGRALPPYYDPHYDCQMELLRFDSRAPSQKYSSLIDVLRDKLAYVSVVATAAVPTFEPNAFRHAAASLQPAFAC